MRTNHADVWAFHTRFGVPAPETPRLMAQEDFEFRFKFLQEELAEIAAAQDRGDLAGVADGLVDLVYVALGTAIWMGLPWQLLWDEVQAANMSKQLARSAAESLDSTGRGHKFDVVKPKDFQPPRIFEVLEAFIEFQKTGRPTKLQEIQRTRKGWIPPNPASHRTPKVQNAEEPQ